MLLKLDQGGNWVKHAQSQIEWPRISFLFAHPPELINMDKCRSFCEYFNTRLSLLSSTFLSLGLSIRWHKVSSENCREIVFSHVLSCVNVCVQIFTHRGVVMWKTERSFFSERDYNTTLCVGILYYRLLADLNCPLFTPDAISMDRKHIVEDIESKYREFITATLRCLSELKRELCESHIWVILTPTELP